MIHYYNIHGFVLAVDDRVNPIFLREYGWSKQHSEPSHIDLLVRCSLENKALPTKVPGCRGGIYVPYLGNQRTLLYSPDVPMNVVLSYCEGLFWWHDKTMLHAGGVAKDGKSFIFTGTGNVGKTSTVLKLLKSGYNYLSDDWILVDGRVAYPMPKTLHVFDYNLRNPDIARRVLGYKRFLYSPLFALLNFSRTYAPHRYLRYAIHAARPVFNANIHTINPAVKIAEPCPIDSIFFLERRKADSITFSDDITARELARKMAYVSYYEWHFIFREYYRYVAKYGIKEERMETRLEHDISILERTFESKNLYHVIIPHGLDLTRVHLLNRLNFVR